MTTPSQRVAFTREYCIFNLVRNAQEFIKINEKEASLFATRAYIKECYQMEKEALILTQIKFNPE